MNSRSVRNPIFAGLCFLLIPAATVAAPPRQNSGWRSYPNVVRILARGGGWVNPNLEKLNGRTVARFGEDRMLVYDPDRDRWRLHRDPEYRSRRPMRWLKVNLPATPKPGAPSESMWGRIVSED